MPVIPEEVTALMAEFQGNLDSFKGQVKETFSGLDLTTVAAFFLVMAVAIIIYDLLVYLLASATTARSMMLSPVLTKLATEAWEKRDEFGFMNLIESKSIDNFYPVLESLTAAAEKYDDEEIPSLQSALDHEKKE